MKTGLVLGKFMPPHNGHLALVAFAKQRCDVLLVLVCATKNEPIDGGIRKLWLLEIFKNDNQIKVVFLGYDENELPNTSAASELVAKIWATYILQNLPKIDVVFSSEEYGRMLARFMLAEAVDFDISRHTVPISASLIRAAPIKYWKFLPSIVQSYFVQQVVLLGSESTGKTILTERLAGHFNTSFVPEIAREVVEKTNTVTPDDLQKIALLHAIEITKKRQVANKLLFIDTDVNITKSYSNYLFKQKLETTSFIETANRAQLYLFLDIDCPFVQDGTRLNENERIELSHSHISELKNNGIKYQTITGTWQQRFDKAVEIVKQTFFNETA